MISLCASVWNTAFIIPYMLFGLTADWFGCWRSHVAFYRNQMTTDCLCRLLLSCGVMNINSWRQCTAWSMCLIRFRSIRVWCLRDLLSSRGQFISNEPSFFFFNRGLIYTKSCDAAETQISLIDFNEGTYCGRGMTADQWQDMFIFSACIDITEGTQTDVSVWP